MEEKNDVLGPKVCCHHKFHSESWLCFSRGMLKNSQRFVDHEWKTSKNLLRNLMNPMAESKASPQII